MKYNKKCVVLLFGLKNSVSQKHITSLGEMRYLHALFNIIVDVGFWFFVCLVVCGGGVWFGLLFGFLFLFFLILC